MPGVFALAGASAGAAPPAKTPGLLDDRLPHPPHRREYRSPGGSFVLAVLAVDGWRQLAAEATLDRVQAGQSVRLWSQPIPQQLGPRAALVSDTGAVLLIDEGINVRSRYALMVLDPKGNRVATHGFDALMQAARASQADVKAHARSGTWVGDAATLTPGGNVAHVPFGKGTLAVSLTDGRLTLLR